MKYPAQNKNDHIWIIQLVEPNYDEKFPKIYRGKPGYFWDGTFWISKLGVGNGVAFFATKARAQQEIDLHIAIDFYKKVVIRKLVLEAEKSSG